MSESDIKAAQDQTSAASSETSATAIDPKMEQEVDQNNLDEQHSEAQVQDQPQELTDDEKYLNCMDAINMVIIRRPIFYKTLKLVRNEEDGAELKKQIAALPEMKTSALTPGFFLNEMAQRGALEATPVYAEESTDAPDDAQDQTVETEPQAEHETAESEVQVNVEAETAQNDQAVGDEAQEAQAINGEPSEQAEQTDQTDQADKPVEERKPINYLYHLTEVGERVIQTLSPSKHLERLYQKDEELDPAFDFVLDFCTQPRKRTDLEKELSSRGFLESKDVSTSFYVDRLERAGGLVWDGGWTTTEEGRDFLDQAV